MYLEIGDLQSINVCFVQQYDAMSGKAQPSLHQYTSLAFEVNQNWLRYNLFIYQARLQVGFAIAIVAGLTNLAVLSQRIDAKK